MQDAEEPPEPRIQPDPAGRERHFNATIERIASVMTSVVAALLVVLVGLATLSVVVDVWTALHQQHELMRAAITGLDSAFVVIILLELVHTTLSRGPVTTQIQEFLVIGVTSAIRTGLETAAGRTTDNGREIAIDLSITSLAALLLVAALWLVRQRLHVEASRAKRREAASAPASASASARQREREGEGDDGEDGDTVVRRTRAR